MNRNLIMSFMILKICIKSPCIYTEIKLLNYKRIKNLICIFTN